MNCIHCGKPIEHASLDPSINRWRHSEDRMYTCFDDNGPMRTPDRHDYLYATPPKE